MSKLYSLDPITLDFFEQAKYRAQKTVTINCSTARMMDALKDADQWVQWAGPMKSADWTSTPGLKDSTRDVYLAGGILLKERFFHWEENECVCFCVDQASAPGLKSFGEQHRIVSLGENQTQLTMTVAFEPTTGGQILAPFIYLALKFIAPKFLKKYKTILETT